MQENAAHIRIAVSRQGPAPCFQRIDIFDAAGKSQVLNGLHHQPRVLVKPLGILVEAYDIGAVLAELHIACGCNAHRLLCIRGHFLSVNVNRAAVRSQNLILPAADLGAPFLAMFVEQASGLLRVDKNRARVPAVLNRELIELAQYSGRTHAREAVNGHHRNVFAPDARFYAAIEILASEYLVQVARYLRQSERMIHAADAPAQISEQPVINMLPTIIINGADAPQPLCLEELSEYILKRIQL